MLGAASISGVPALGLPKMNSLVGGIFIPTLGFSTVVDQRKEGQPLGLQDILEPVDGFIDRMTTRLVDDSFCGSHPDPRNPAAYLVALAVAN
jgi:hypothetical protein